MALVHIKKRVKPIEIEYERAKKLKNRKYGYDGMAKASDTDQVDLGEWAGQYSEIISIDTSSSQPQQYGGKVYTNQECKEFEVELTEFLNEKGWLTLEGEYKFLKLNMVINFRKKVDGKGITASDFEMAVIKDKVLEFKELTDRLEAWKSYKGRKDYAKNKELEKTAEESGI